MNSARVADLQLRGSAGPLPLRVSWPVAAGEPPLVVLAAGDPVRTALCSLAVVVALSPATPVRDATTALEWAADHAAELGADPDRLVVAGHGAGGGVAAALALAARDGGWPRLARQVLIHPALAPRPVSLRGVAPATVVTSPDDDGGAYAAGLRHAGVAVDEVPLGPGRLLTGVPPTLRRALRVAIPIYASEIDAVRGAG